MNVIHRAPTPGVGVLTCCMSSVLAVPGDDRITTDPGSVTCPGDAPDVTRARREALEDAVYGAPRDWSIHDAARRG